MKLSLVILLFLVTGCGTTHYHNALCNNQEYYDKWSAKCDEFSVFKPLGVSGLGSAILLNSMNAGNSVTPNAYGLGIGMNQYGQPVTLQGGMPNSYIQKQDAYGPGIHMDQYGRPVQYR